MSIVSRHAQLLQQVTLLSEKLISCSLFSLLQVINISHFKNVDEEELLKVPGVKYVPLVGKVISRFLPPSQHYILRHLSRQSTAVVSHASHSVAEQHNFR